MNVTIRPYEHGDLGRVLQLWERANGSHGGDLSTDEAVDLMHSAPAVTLVAEADGELVGAALGSSSAAVGWVHRLVVDRDPATERGLRSD